MDIPRVERFASYLAEGFGCSDLIHVTASDPERARRVRAGAPQDAGELVSYDAATEIAESSIVVAMLDSPSGADALFDRLRHDFGRAPVAIVVAPPAGQIARPKALQRVLARRGLHVPFAGWARDGARGVEASLLIAIVDSGGDARRVTAPADFRVVAFMPTYNEADVIRHSLTHLTAQGIDVHVIDNWSNDGTFEEAEALLGTGVVAVERFPASGPPDICDWRGILGRVESLSRETSADWFMLHDADERRQTPWENVSLRTGLHYVGTRGFNCVDHVVLNYCPIDDRFDPNHDVETQLRHYTFSDDIGHFHQRKAWKNLGGEVSLAASAGHDVRFAGRLVYPFKFLLKHYPIRCQAHGERKVFGDRASRFHPEERAFGGLAQYDGFTPGDSFLRDPATLEHVDGSAFAEKYLIERLSGIGVFYDVPEWATAPRESFDEPREALR